MIRVTHLLILLFVALGSARANAQTLCRDLFATPMAQIDLAVRDLARLRLSLDLAQAQSPATPQLKALKKVYVQKEVALISYLESQGFMSRTEFMKQLKQEIAKAQSSETLEDSKKENEKNIERNKIRSAQIDGSVLVFHPIQPGRYRMGAPVAKVGVELTKPFAMAATQTTQVVWRKIVIASNRNFSARRGLLEEDPSRFKGQLRPVESVSYEEVQNWIAALNELALIDDPVVTKMMPGHKKGDFYRLPTEAEWEYVVRSQGPNWADFFYGQNPKALENYAWFLRNSGNETHDVALKMPLILNGRSFFDFHGNVWEFVSDWHQVKLSGGKDPTGPKTGQFRVIRGGSWNDETSGLQTWVRFMLEPQKRSDAYGFRLVRVSQ
jgi:formylglycine-generating enzyme required for sulfatase activity